LYNASNNSVNDNLNNSTNDNNDNSTNSPNNNDIINNDNSTNSPNNNDINNNDNSTNSPINNDIINNDNSTNNPANSINSTNSPANSINSTNNDKTINSINNLNDNLTNSTDLISDTKSVSSSNVLTNSKKISQDSKPKKLPIILLCDFIGCDRIRYNHCIICKNWICNQHIINNKCPDCDFYSKIIFGHYKNWRCYETRNYIFMIYMILLGLDIIFFVGSLIMYLYFNNNTNIIIGTIIITTIILTIIILSIILHLFCICDHKYNLNMDSNSLRLINNYEPHIKASNGIRHINNIHRNI